MSKQHIVVLLLIITSFDFISPPLKSDGINLKPISKASVKGCYLEDYPHPKTSNYILPFKKGLSFTVSQGNCGKFDTHRPKCTATSSTGVIDVCGDRRYAYDFDMPIGAAILAIRAGKVVYLQENFVDGTNDFNQTNYISIQHDDETIAVYVHLAQEGVLVEIGDQISQGQEIAKAGNSGYTGGNPHLHLDVLAPPFDTCNVNDLSGCKTIPITFKNAYPLDAPLIEGKRYTAH